MDELISNLFSFKVLNFIFVVSVFIYFIKSRLVPLLNKNILDKNSAILEVKTSTKQAQEEQKEVIKTIEDQKLYAQNLLDKMKQWNAVIDEENEIQGSIEKDSKKRLKAYVNKQQQALLLEHLKKEMIPCVMKEATEALEKYFDKQNAQENFLDATFESMEKE